MANEPYEQQRHYTYTRLPSRKSSVSQRGISWPSFDIRMMVGGKRRYRAAGVASGSYPAITSSPVDVITC